MYFLYIDETYERKAKYLILGGLIINEAHWIELNKNIKELKLKYFKNDSVNLRDIRRKNYDKNENYLSLDADRKKEFDNELYSLLSLPHFTYVASLINTKKMERSKRRFIFQLAYSFLIERFQYFLQENKERGIIIMDESKSTEIKSLFDYHKSCLEKGVPNKAVFSEVKHGEDTFQVKSYEYMEIPHIVEHLFFLDDKHSNHIQIADMVCSAISGKFNRKRDFYYKKIEQNIRKDPKTGKMEGYGLKFFPTED